MQFKTIMEQELYALRFLLLWLYLRGYLMDRAANFGAWIANLVAHVTIRRVGGFDRSVRFIVTTALALQDARLIYYKSVI